MSLIKTFYTENSIYEFNDRRHEYRRTPRFDPQPNFSHRLVYGEWLPLREYFVIDDGEGGQCLQIFAHDSTYGIYTTPLTYPEEMS